MTLKLIHNFNFVVELDVATVTTFRERSSITSLGLLTIYTNFFLIHPMKMLIWIGMIKKSEIILEAGAVYENDEYGEFPSVINTIMLKSFCPKKLCNKTVRIMDVTMRQIAHS